MDDLRKIKKIMTLNLSLLGLITNYSIPISSAVAAAVIILVLVCLGRWFWR